MLINHVQIDTNAYCGSKCFCCPVRYYKRPHISLMSNILFDSILCQLDTGISDGYVSPNYMVWLSSYNDILHDTFLKDRLDIMRQHGKSFQLLTNAVKLLESVDLLDEYQDVIQGFSINIPAGNKESYQTYTQNDQSFFDHIIKGLTYLYSKNPFRYKQIVSIIVNGVYDDPIGRIQMKFDMPMEDTNTQVSQLKELQPFNVHDARPLCDRAGLLRAVNIIDNQAEGVREQWKLPVGTTKAAGCNGGSRLLEWVHISSKGDLYTCCQDYLEKYSYGNLSDTSLKDLLFSDEHDKIIDKTLEELCINCWFAY